MGNFDAKSGFKTFFGSPRPEHFVSFSSVSRTGPSTQEDRILKITNTKTRPPKIPRRIRVILLERWKHKKENATTKAMTLDGIRSV